MSEQKQTLESYKSEVKLKETKLHYRYAVGIALFFGLVLGTVGGYFLSINLVSDAQSKVVNSIQVSVKESK